MKLRILNLLLLTFPQLAWAQTGYTDFENDTLVLNQVEVRAASGRVKNGISPLNTETIGREELFRAACCNLSESFNTNPSVDVNYSDAATGAKQIKLLGLSGTYVQMLNENIPAYQGAAIPFALGYVPGTWMQSIQVSKGASSVKNGFEGLTGQINIEYLKPQGTEQVNGNLYLDSKLKLDANADAEMHLTDKLSTALLLHYEQSTLDHDGNHDNFSDMPRVRQYNVMNRWAWVSSKLISQLVVRGLKEKRQSGQSKHAGTLSYPTAFGSMAKPYGIEMNTDHVEATWKNALVLNRENNANIAAIGSITYHDAQNTFGMNTFDVNQVILYGQLLFEMDLDERQSISTGASLTLDDYSHNLQMYDFYNLSRIGGHIENGLEKTAGIYAQYTYKLGEKLSAMAGFRGDYSGLWGKFFTPRLHVKYSPFEWGSVRLSFGKGYRSPHALAENLPLLASGRRIEYTKPSPANGRLKQEEGWNAGTSISLNVPLADEELLINADYYYTWFKNQVVVDRDQAGWLLFYNLPEGGKSYSQVMQIDVTYPFKWGISATAAFRYQDVQTTYWLNEDKTIKYLRMQPLTSRYKALLTVSWHDPLELWKADVTYQLNGDGRLPDPVNKAWRNHYNAFGQLSAQVTREFQHYSVYAGAENLTGFKQKNPIIGYENPFGSDFDATMVWGPTEGAMFYVGVRVNFENMDSSRNYYEQAKDYCKNIRNWPIFKKNLFSFLQK